MLKCIAQLVCVMRRSVLTGQRTLHIIKCFRESWCFVSSVCLHASRGHRGIYSGWIYQLTLWTCTDDTIDSILTRCNSKKATNLEESAPRLTHLHDLNPRLQLNDSVINFASDNYIFYYRILSKRRCATLSEGSPIKLFVSVCLFN